MTEDPVSLASTYTEPSIQPDTNAIAGLSSRILESTNEQLELASVESGKKAGKEEAEPEEPLRVTSLVHRNGYLLETVYKPEEGKWPLCFNYYQPVKRREFGSSIPFDINKIKPPLLDDMVRQGVVLLPSKGIPLPAVHQAGLVDRLVRFIHRYLDIPPFWEKMVAHYILITWVYDRFTAVPYLRLLSEHNTGKSRFLQVVGALCYKSVICGGSVSVSSIFRLTDQWRGTIAIDECDFNHSSEWAEIVRLLNCGYMARLPAIRAESVGRSFTPRAFYVFGPKILAGRHRFDDSALESRCLTYTPEERKLRDDIPRQLPEGFWDEALDLRNQLLGWRFENFDALQVDESPLLHLDPRLAQIGTTIHSVTKDDVFRDEYLRFLSDFGQQDRAERPQSVIVEAIRDLTAEMEDNRNLIAELKANGDASGAELSSDSCTYLTVKAVTDRANILIQERGGQRLGPKRVGGIIRSVGFKPQRARDGYRFSPDPKRIEELVEKYVPKHEV
jgi:hypothetical protein